MSSKTENLENTFRVLSYAAVLCGFLSLFVSGAFGLIGTALFLGIFAGSWFLEDSRWQLSERLGTVLVVLALPLFYLGWKMRLFGFSGRDTLIAGILAQLILTLTAIKLLQKKSDRDWIFLYLMAFFEVLLAAGLSISALYLGTFLLYLLVTICAIIVFEIRKTSKIIREKTFQRPIVSSQSSKAYGRRFPVRRLPLTGFSLILLIILFAAPIFFLLPRVGGAGMGGNSNISQTTGFSDSVRLGEIGRIQQNDEVAMRVRIEGERKMSNLRWRGVALDRFDNKNWSRSNRNERATFTRDEKGWIKIDSADSRRDLVVQTVYLEPMTTPTLFALPRAVVVQGNFNSLDKDAEGGIQFPRINAERISYKVYSDAGLPPIAELQKDNEAYSQEQASKYLQLPADIDPRISELAAQITQTAGNRYDKAKTIESYLQTRYGYTLELKASGDQPVADFLFNVREGHCEYFATAMALMLRTQGIATRVVNGFQTGDYNETADVFVVKQRNAHSWVEVYFPDENSWVAFDPTPFAGQTVGNDSSSGLLKVFNRYLEALETFWIQYFVAYDNQEQQTLLRSVKSGLMDFQAKSSDWLADTQEKLSDWWKKARGDQGWETSAAAIGYAIGYVSVFVLGIVLLVRLYRRIAKTQFWKRGIKWLRRRNQAGIVEFYERMQKVLASKGLVRPTHQTPLEFAYALEMPEAISITERYNRVRFGEKALDEKESAEIETWLKRLEENEVSSK